MEATQPVALSVDHSQSSMGAPTFSTSVCDSRASFSAFEMTLTEGNKLEKKLFYSTFATVSNKYSAWDSSSFLLQKLQRIYYCTKAP